MCGGETDEKVEYNLLLRDEIIGYAGVMGGKLKEMGNKGEVRKYNY